MRRAGFAHEPFGDAPPELIGPVMASLPGMEFEEADNTVIREVFARIDAQAGLPAVTERSIGGAPTWCCASRPSSASLAAAERAGVPHAHVCIGMHEVATGFAKAVAEPLEELGRLAGLADGQANRGTGGRDRVQLGAGGARRRGGRRPPEAAAYLRFHEPAPAAGADLPRGATPTSRWST